MPAVPNTNVEVVTEFRANGGVVPAPYDNPPPMVLLHTVGRRTSREHIVPMRGLPDGDVIQVFATAHGSDRDPDWFHNVVANPDLVIERGPVIVAVRATVLDEPERSAVIQRWTERVPQVAGVFARTPRQIPVVRLKPRRDGNT